MLKTSERQILSKRFITRFYQIGADGYLPYKEISTIFDITVKTLEQYLDGTHLITIEEAYIFCEYLEDYEYMFQDITNWQESLSFKLNCGFRSPQLAVGGCAISHFNAFKPSIDKNIKAEKRVFEVDGDSMTGGRNNLVKGDVLETESLRYMADFKESALYVIESDYDGTYVKELQSLKEGGKIIGFRCISDSNIYYKPFDITGNSNTKIYKVTRVIKESVKIRLKQAIGNNKIKKVFKSLISTFHDDKQLILLQSRFNELSELICGGMIENGLDSEMNKIRSSLFDIVDKIEDEDLSTIDLFKL